LPQIYTFTNIRFAAPPTGKSRWRKPQPAQANDTLQDGSYGNKCPQAPLEGLNVFGDGANPVTAAVSAWLANNLLAPIAETGGAEDCLFLDIYVPGSAVRNPSAAKLPVLHWIYGGGYVLGAKDQLSSFGLPFYDGSGLITQSGNSLIFVSSNYRLGAFGFLAGTTMEQQGVPNAGLWDQRAAGEWIAANINLLGGDAAQVTVMGESAGAGSIMHHLAAAGGTMAPWFSRAIMQSPAFQPMWDRKGALEDTTQKFLTLAGCGGQGIDCLRGADAAALIAANTALNTGVAPGTFAVGPAADGTYVRQLAQLELASGNFVGGVSALLVSHVADEAAVFVDGSVASDAQLNALLDALFPDYAVRAGLVADVEARYAAQAFATEAAKVRAVVRDSSFTCNARALIGAYSPTTPTFAMQYSVTPGWHGTDLLPTFWSDGLAASPLGLALELAAPLFTTFANKYKSYIGSLVRAGDPNRFRDRGVFTLPWTVDWPQVASTGSADQQFTNVLDAGDFRFRLIADAQDQRDPCQFWVDVLAAATSEGGYAPPGSVVGSPLGNATGGAASSNYVS